MSVQVIKSEDEFKKSINVNKLVVVDFYATWCGPCKVISPKMEEMAKEFTDVVFYKVDVDEVADVAEQCGISAMPTFQFYKNGAKVSEFKGANADKLREEINKNK